MRRALAAGSGAGGCALLAVACQPELEKQSQLLDRVRLLALRADPPEADVTGWRPARADRLRLRSRIRTGV